MKIDNFKFTVSEDSITLSFNDGQTRVYKFDKVTDNLGKPVHITDGVTIKGSKLEFNGESVELADIVAIFDTDFSTYLLTDTDLKYITTKFNDVDGKIAKRIAEHIPHLTEFNDHTFIADVKIKDFIVDVKLSNTNGSSGFIFGAVVGDFFIPVGLEKVFDDALLSCLDYRKKFEVN